MNLAKPKLTVKLLDKDNKYLILVGRDRLLLALSHFFLIDIISYYDNAIPPEANQFLVYSRQRDTVVIVKFFYLEDSCHYPSKNKHFFPGFDYYRFM